MYYYFNHLWQDLKAMEKELGIPFKDNYTLEQLEKRFKREGKQITINDLGL